jgi:hypothetical protein
MKPSPTILSDMVKVIDKTVKKIRKDLKSDAMVCCMKSMSAEEFSRQACSIRIGLPRRSGNTTLALKLLDKYPKAIYVGSTLALTEAVMGGYKGKANDNTRFFSVNMQNIGHVFSGKKPEIVVTDCLDYASKEAVARMYRCLSVARPIYIHLGS